MRRSETACRGPCQPPLPAGGSGSVLFLNDFLQDQLVDGQLEHRPLLAALKECPALARQDVARSQLVDDLLEGVFSLRRGPECVSMPSSGAQHLDHNSGVGRVYQRTY